MTFRALTSLPGRLLRSARRDDGAYTAVGLAFMGLVAVPLTVVLLNSSLFANASSQAEGMAYNLSYAAATRAVNPDTSAGAPTIRLDQQNQAVYDDLETAKDAAVQASSATGAAGRFTFTLDTMPNRAAYTGVPDGTGTVTPNAAIINTAYSARDAVVRNCAENNTSFPPPGSPFTVDQWRFLGCAYNRNVSGDAFSLNRCHPDQDTGVNLSDASNGQAVCWVDRRSGVPGAATPASSAWDHFSPGAQVSLRVGASLFGGAGQVSAQRIGVATFGRPCQGPGATQQPAGSEGNCPQ